ncbi:MAG TPA: menaquinone biosynthesis protein [Thermogutta sp.]|nr:menaquinone biosynthesis protein [Thermogutta sp.]HQF13676.1 menaquinone biosynthesis protein [Thermogutta sp.]
MVKNTLSKVSDSESRAGKCALKVGGVCYLNARPLLQHLADLCPHIVIEYDVPSRLAAKLAAGQLDIAIIPAVEALRGDGYVVVSDACISAKEAAKSVILFSRVPLDQIRSVALDAGSRMSAALTRVLLAEWYGVTPEIRDFPLEKRPEEAKTDAVLLIGDRAMVTKQPPGYPLRFDLGSEWRKWTDRPFVFALWVARSGVTDLDSWHKVFSLARDRGLDDLVNIAQAASRDLGLSFDECHQYLSKNMHYRLGEDELESLTLFRSLAVKHGILAASARLTFHGG